MIARITERDKRRLNKLVAIIKPETSLAARLEKLTPSQREYYGWWKERCDCYIKQHPDGEAYARLLDGFGPFNGLRDDISTVLFGETPEILDADSDELAAQKYRDYLR
jgi:hypothetical protein